MTKGDGVAPIALCCCQSCGSSVCAGHPFDQRQNQPDEAEGQTCPHKDLEGTQDGASGGDEKPQNDPDQPIEEGCHLSQDVGNGDCSRTPF